MIYYTNNSITSQRFVMNPLMADSPTWRRQWHPTPVVFPGKSHGWRSLVGCSPWGCEESDTTEGLHFHFSLSWIGEGNGNPLQCSCLENPRDGGAWWAAVYGVTQSWTWLTRLSSSSRSMVHWVLCLNCSDDIHGQDFKLAEMLNFSRMYVWSPRRAPLKWS